MRTGPELVRATAPYAREDRTTTWRLLVGAAAVYGGAIAVVLLVPAWPIKLAASALAGLTLIRLFIFYHDFLHGALLQGSPVGRAVMNLVGYWMLNPPSVWRQTHDYHHKHTAKMVGAAIGSFPVITVDMWREITPAQRRQYRLIRHPLNMVFGYFTVFILGMCISAFRRNPRQHYGGILALLLHFTAMGLVAGVFGPSTALLAVFLPSFISSGLGAYLFYAQHNFPDMQIRGRHEWDYSFAATRSSSLFEMGPVMRWFTGNIGFHHVHHLNHRIPFYRLPEAMAALPELQDPGRTSWKPADIAACLRLKLWHPAQGRMLSFEEAETVSAMDGLLSAK